MEFAGFFNQHEYSTNQKSLHLLQSRALLTFHGNFTIYTFRGLPSIQFFLFCVT